MRFNIAGAFSKRKELRLYFFNNKNIIKNFDITVYDGINNCSWNGGRINRDICYDDKVINFYYRNNISIALTFTNPVIDLTDKTGNELLKKFHKKGNVIKVSFGAAGGGGNLAVKLKDPKARKAFADRHNCEQKNDKTKPGYWSCRLPRYAKSLGLSGGGTWW